jgi:hypothetical protein
MCNVAVLGCLLVLLASMKIKITSIISSLLKFGNKTDMVQVLFLLCVLSLSVIPFI